MEVRNVMTLEQYKGANNTRISVKKYAKHDGVVKYFAVDDKNTIIAIGKTALESILAGDVTDLQYCEVLTDSGNYLPTIFKSKPNLAIACETILSL